MKKLALIAIGLTLSLTSFSQGKYGATPEDSVACIESLIYKDYMKSDKKLAMELWRVAYKTCPQSQKTLYINGVKLYEGLAKKAEKAKNESLKEAYLDTMFSIYDQRIEMFGQRGFVLGYKGQSMLVNRPKEKQKIFDLLNESISITKNKSQAGTLVAVMFATINLEKAGAKTSEDVVEMFEKTSAICAANTGGKYADKYAKAQEKIQNVSSPYLNCEVLVPLAEKNFEANKADVDWLRRTVKLLKAKKCYEAPIFSKVAEEYFKLEPSAEGAEGMGKLFLGKKDYSKAIEFFKKAEEMAQTDEEKAQYNLSIAEANLYAKSYSAARTYAQKAANLKSGWGEPYMVIGDAYMYSAKSCDDGKLGRYGAYWAAVDKYQKAKSIDGSVAGDANKKIARASANYPLTKDVFFHSFKNGDSYKVACWINETTTVRTK
jgi:tetratricopeptide (TPR) repeat protein